ncbi:hypothetical protein K461DRAFT_310841 [Myriangium duriaei CBS 260.36]|uniref:Uncharacterized protein n=1 Tax=Myriangium duriaei CBS 260.36 TaxID=1168546 RepID=A0A9P4MRA1_9PEZI|nr:hypothetical protein K461DRAFT_310841 [Myriangium duriaei CBS 260.36]
MKAFIQFPVLVATLAGQAYAAVNVFMTITDATTANTIVTDASSTTLVKNAIELSTWSFGTEQTINLSSQSSGAGAGKIKFDSFSFTKPVDGNTNVIFNRMAQGRANTVNVYFFKSSGGATASTTPYMTLQFRLAAFFSQSLSGTDGGDVPMESTSFEYGAMQISYATQNNQGVLANPTTLGWNAVKNMPETSAVPKTT